MLIAIVQARVSSSRLPGKVLKRIGQVPMLLRQLDRLRNSSRIDKVVVATGEGVEDDAIEALCSSVGVSCFRGSLNDVLDRIYRASLAFAADHIVRITGDCPLIDPYIIDQVIDLHLASGCAYTSNVNPPTFPDGMDVEILTFRALEQSCKEAKLPSEREHVTQYVRNRPSVFSAINYRNNEDLSAIRLTVDTEADFQLVDKIFNALAAVPNFHLSDIITSIKANPEWLNANQHLIRNEGLSKSMAEDLSIRYRNSQDFHKRASNVIPLAAQTFSKSKTHYPWGVSPYFIDSGKGSVVWDVDGNEYTDFINSLCSITLGYCDPDVDGAVRAQIDKGVIFSLSGTLETEVAEKLVSMIPCAEMVRFGKNGSDATSGAVRLARAYTGRDRIAVCGYHGWQDWYIGSTARNKGVPSAVSALTHVFQYNSLESLSDILRKHPGEFAAVILEPMNVVDPVAGFLEGVKSLAHQHGALLVFDETITGFRFANGGAQAYFNVTPDLATFGKGLANGYPLSAVVGRKDIMILMEEIFFSFTFGGELLSLAASNACLDKYAQKDVVKTMFEIGTLLKKGVVDLIGKHDLTDILSISGHPAWTFLSFKDHPTATLMELKTFFLQEVFCRGILTAGTHNISFSHTKADIAKLLNVYDEVFGMMAKLTKQGSLKSALRTDPLVSLFKIR